jgi:hypothetical protein
MREVFGQKMADWILLLFDQVWHSVFSVAAFTSGVWRDGLLWNQISFLTLTALLGYTVLAVGPKGLLLIRRILGGLACLLVVLMAVVPTLAITFLALVGGIWIAKSF